MHFNRASSHDDATEVIKSLLLNYDARLRPDFQGEVSLVGVCGVEESSRDFILTKEVLLPLAQKGVGRLS